MERWAEFVLRHRKWVVAFWLAVMVAGAGVSGTVSDRMTIDFKLPGEPGTKAADKIVATFGNGGHTSPALVSITVPKGSTVAENADAVHAAFEQLVPDLAAADQPTPVRVVDQASTVSAEHPQGDPAFVTDDGRTSYAYVFYPFPRSQTELAPTEQLQESLDASLDESLPGASAGVTGVDALAVGDEDAGGPGVLAETLIGAVGALAVLAFVFASLLAFLPLVIAAVSILATFLMLLPLTYATDVSFIVQFLVALIGLGVAIDYSLILVTRWREERDHGRDNHDAVVESMKHAGHAVLFSGITVAIGLVALVLLPVPFMRSIGMGGALIPFASVAVTLSLTPAILGGIGPRIDWPKVRHENKASAFWSRWAAMIVRHRWIGAGVAFALLGALLVAFAGIKIGAPSSDSLAKNGPAYDTLQVLERGGVTTGVLTPIEILVDSDKAETVREQLVAADVDGIDDVLLTPGAGSNNARGSTVLLAVPATETVNNKTVQPVRDLEAVADGIDGVRGVTGLGMAQVDFLHAVYGNFPYVLAIIALLTYVLLVRAFRSLLLPLKAVILNLVSLAAVYGAMRLFWQDGFGSDEIFGIQETGAITFWVPLMLFAFLYGLSMDYEVFILARVREEYDNGHSTNEAVIEGIGRTGRLVTSAALILFLAFAALASGPGTDLKIMATGLGFGILLDATVVRSLLVPSLVSLFGRWNWYLPDGVARVLRIPPSVLHEEKDTTAPVAPA